MHKIVYNACYGGFSLSLKAIDWLEQNAKDKTLISKIKEFKKSNETLYWNYAVDDIPRHHKDLVAVVEYLGSKEASGGCASLKIREIVGNLYKIDDYDGFEDVITPNGDDWIVIE